MQKSLLSLLLPGLLAVLGIVALVIWAGTAPIPEVQARIPGLDKAPPRSGENSETASHGRTCLRPGKTFRTCRLLALVSRYQISMPFAKTRSLSPGNGRKPDRKNFGPSNSATATPPRQSAPAAYMCSTTSTMPQSINSAASHSADREKLAAALNSTTPDKFDSLENTLRRLFPLKGSDPNDPQRGLSEGGICRGEKYAWRNCSPRIGTN